MASYSYNCSVGRVAIISLRLNNASRVTIEIDLLRNKIIQARGKYNRLPTNEEREVIFAWERNKII